MSIKRVKINAQDLVMGMFVSGLDVPWSKTPFPLQGFHVRQPQDIEKVKHYSTYVYIDVTRGRNPSPGTKIYATQSDADEAVEEEEKVPAYDLKPARADLNKLTASPPRPIEIRQGVYEKTVPLRTEAVVAERIVRELKGNLSLVMKQIAKGKPVNYADLHTSVDDMVASVIRCPDAFNWLLRLRQKDQHSYDHSLRVAMLAAQFGRYAGMSRGDITVLCMGALLKDVGRVRLPRHILRNPDRGPEEEAEYRRFVEYGVEILRSMGNIDPKVISVVRYHRERLDGTGFPQGVAGSKIPVLARVVGVATVYDAISNPRESREPVAPSRAVSLLYNMRNQAFQEDLVVKFIQSIGLYPTGTVVELTTGDLAVVLEQSPRSRLSPTVAVLDRTGENLGENCLFVDLQDNQRSRKILLDSGRDDVMHVGKLAIARDLEPGTYDIDLSTISSLYLQMESSDTPRKRGLSGLSGLVSRLIS